MKTPIAIVAAVMVAAAPAAAQASPRDRDHDRIPDRWERRHHVKTARGDSDHDRLTNLTEYRAGTNPHRKDSDRDGTWDALEDRDRDQVDNVTEQRERTNPARKDTDRDGRPDGAEDADHDRLLNAAEDATNNDPADSDTDGDGVGDGAEGAGQVVSLVGDQLTIALGTPKLDGTVRSPLAMIATDGQRVTGKVVLPEALVCGTADEWKDVPARATTTDSDAQDAEGDDAADPEADEDEQITTFSARTARAFAAARTTAHAASADDAEDAPQADFEPEEDTTGTWAPEQPMTDAELEAKERAEAIANGDDEDDQLADACPDGILQPGAWVHEVELSVSAESGIEFDEIVIVR